MAAAPVQHGVSVDLVDTSASLPPITGRSRNSLAITRSGEGWILDFTPGVGLFWRQFLFPGGGGGPGAKLLYIVAQNAATPGLPTPMGALAGVFPNVNAAGAQAVSDFAALGTPLNADILLMPGSYPGFRLRPGMQVSSLVDGGYQQLLIPPTPHTDIPAVLVTGPVQILAADGWVSGVITPSASLKGVRVDSGAAHCVDIDAAVSGGIVQIADCQLVSSTIGIHETPGAADLTVMLDNSRIEALGAAAFDGALCRLQGFNSTRITGTLSTSTYEGLAFSDSLLLGARITATGPVPPGTGLASARFFRTSLIDLGSGLSVVQLNNDAIAFFEAGCAIQNGPSPTIDGTGGGVILAAGAIPGFYSAPSTITFSSVTLGRSLNCNPSGTPDLDANGYIAPVGAGPFSYVLPNAGIELVVIDCSGADPGAQVTITVPNAREALAWSELDLKRIDDAPVSVRILRAAPNEFDKTTPPTTEISLGPNGTRKLIASREPSGVGRWLVS